MTKKDLIAIMAAAQKEEDAIYEEHVRTGYVNDNPGKALFEAIADKLIESGVIFVDATEDRTE